MLSKRIFETDFKTALTEELERKNLTVKGLAALAGIPASTLYKSTTGDRDVRLNTIKKILSVLEPERNSCVAVIAARFLLDSLDFKDLTIAGKTYSVRGYPANSLDECIIAAVRAEKDGAAGIVCAPVLASIVEKIVDVPVTMLNPGQSCVTEAIGILSRKIE